MKDDYEHEHEHEHEHGHKYEYQNENTVSLNKHRNLGVHENSIIRDPSETDMPDRIPIGDRHA